MAEGTEVLEAPRRAQGAVPAGTAVPELRVCALPAASDGLPTRRRFTREEYYRMAEVGILSPDERVELIEGEVIAVAPQGPDHAVVGDYIPGLFSAAFGPGFYVRSQRPLSLGQACDPEPDVAVVRGAREDFLKSHPTSAVLVVEVGRSSLAFDRGTKLDLYAAAGIPEYWIVNLEQDLVEVYRDPRPDPIARLGASYSQVVRHGRGATLSPLAAPEAVLRVEDLLPPIPASG